MRAVADRIVTTEQIRELTTYRDIKRLSYLDVGVASEHHLVGHIQDHVQKYKEKSGAYGIYDGDKLVGAILVTDYTLVHTCYLQYKNCYIHPSDCCIIQAIVVDRRYRHKSYGTKLIKYAVCKQRDEGKVLMYADMMHEGLLDFYKRNGFYNIGNNVVVKEIR